MTKYKVLIASTLMAISISSIAKVEIKGDSKQTVTVKNGAIANMAIGAASKAIQTVASNKGNVSIGGSSTQTVSVENGAIANMAIGAASKAEQHIGSNVGD